MKFKPKRMLKRMIMLKHYDEEIYMFITSLATLNGILIGIYLTCVIILLSQPY